MKHFITEIWRILVEARYNYKKDKQYHESLRKALYNRRYICTMIANSLLNEKESQMMMDSLDRDINAIKKEDK